jgi:hypothetical protein
MYIPGLRFSSLGVAIVATSMLTSGCSRAPETARVHPGGHAANSGGILADMGQPALALVVSGQLDGYLEPCGCTRGQAGGLVRRYEFLDRLRRQDWPIIQIDLGGLIGPPENSRPSSELTTIKLRHALKALSLSGCDVMSVNADDLRPGVESTVRMYLDKSRVGMTLVSANLVATGPYAAAIRPSVMISRSGVKLGITSVVAPDSILAIDDPGRNSYLASISSPRPLLTAVLSDLEAATDYQVLMVNGPYELAVDLARSHPGFDIVIAASDHLSARSRHPEILNDGRTRLVTIGRRGMHVGVFAFDRDRIGRPPSYHLVALNDQFDGPGTLIKSVIQNEYRAELRAAGVVERFPRLEPIAPASGAYVGAESCRECHPATFQKWSESKHAHALESLVNDPRPDLVFDPDCIRCHTTGFPYKSGWRSAATTRHLAGNQCESCHGPGSRHVSEPDRADFREPMKTATDAARRTVCARCHDHDNSPDFDFDRYWARIVHKGLDRYADPKTHRGLKMGEEH